MGTVDNNAPSDNQSVARNDDRKRAVTGLLSPRSRALWSWAVTDLSRDPWSALLMGLAVGAFVAVLATGLLLPQALMQSATRVLREGPDLVVRRVGPGGWEPMPQEAVPMAAAVRGVTGVSARIWGPVRWRDRAVTVVTPPSSPLPPREDPGYTAPAPEVGQAVIGPALDLTEGQTFTLHGAASRTFKVQQKLATSTGLVAHDLVLLTPQDARALLGLGEGMASDLALRVFHEAETEAIRPDLIQAFPFSVALSSRRESLGALRAQLERRAGIRTLLLVPALLALLLLTTAMVRMQRNARHEVGLLRALGWTGADVVQLQLARALIVGLPAIALGWLLAYALVFMTGAGWAGTLLFGWTERPPHLALDPSGVALTLLEVGALALAPWLVCVLLPALRSSTRDPRPWLQGEGA